MKLQMSSGLFDPRLAVGLITLRLLMSMGLSADASPTPRNIQFTHLITDDGLSINSVHSIIQDRQGFMWFGTQDGLNKYDGYNFTHYKNDVTDSTSLSNNWIWTVYEDRSGTIWVGTKGGGLNRFNRDNLTFRSYLHDPNDPNSLSDDDVRAIHEDRLGVLWIGTGGGGLCRLVRSSSGEEWFRIYRHSETDPRSLSGNFITCITEDKSGALWIGTADGGLSRLDPKDRMEGVFTHFSHLEGNSNSLSDNEVSAIYTDRSGIIWIGTHGGGLCRLERPGGEEETFTHFKHEVGNPNSLSDDVVLALHEDAEGTLWIGTPSGGLCRLTRDAHGKATFTNYKTDEGDPSSLSNNNVTAIYEDKSAVLWIGTEYGGLSKASASGRGMKGFSHWLSNPDNPKSLSDDLVWTIYEDSHGELWIGTDNGLNRFNREKEDFTRYLTNESDPNSLSHNIVLAIHGDETGSLWIGTRGGGLNRFDKKEERFIHYKMDKKDPGKLPSSVIRSIYEDSSRILWIGTKKGLCRLDPDNRERGFFRRFTYEANNPYSLSDNNVRTIFEDGSGVLWIGTDGGLNKYDRGNETFIRYTKEVGNPNSLSYDQVRSIYEDREGNLWIGTRGGGLNRFDRQQERFAHHTEKDGLISNVVFGILEDRHGNLWLSTPLGISKFDPQTETFRSYRSNDGLHDIHFESGAYFQSKSGEMFFGGARGFVGFYPDHIKDNPYIPPVFLTSFKKFNREVRLGKDISQLNTVELSHSDRMISFEFAALDYTDPEQNRYAYMLEGFDEDWIYSGSNHDATYTNLSPGHYTFRAKGSNSNGAWNDEGLSVSLLVIPPFWKTWWFRLLGGGLLLFIMYGAYQTRVKSIESQRRKLQHLVTQRTDELEQELSQRKKAEVKLRKSEEKLEVIIENLRDVVFQLSRSGIIQYVSPNVWDIYGYKPEELVGKHLKKTTPVNQIPKALKTLKTVISGEPIEDLEIEQMDARGNRVTMEINVTPVKKEGKVIAIQGLMRNITERKRAEEAITKRNIQLELVHRIQNDIPMNLELETILKTAAESIGRSFGYHKISVNLFEKNSDEIVHWVGWNKSGTPTPSGHGQKLGEGLIGKAAEIKKTIVANDVSKEPSYVVYYQTKTKSELSIPLLVDDRLVGVLDIQDIDKNVFTEYDVSALESVANYLAHVIDEKQTEEALRRSEEKYRTLTENVNVGVYRNTTGPKGKFIEANCAIVEMFGLESREEFLSVDVIDLYQNPEDRKKFYDKMSKHGFLEKEELKLKKKDGKPFIASVSEVTIKDEKGKVLYYDGIIEDITERKQIEEAIQQSERHYRTLFEESRDVICVIAPDGKFIDMNEAGMRLFGYTVAEISRLKVDKLYVQRPDQENFEEELRKKRSVAEYDVKLRKKDGTEVDCLLTATLRKAENGSGEGYQVIVRDITERKRVEEKLTALQSQLIQAEKLESVGRLAAGVAHEVKNPLAIILMGVDYMRKHAGNEETRAGAVLKDINDAVIRANSIIQGLLDFSASGKLDSRVEELNAVAERSLLLVKHDLDKYHVAVGKDLGRNIPSLKMDRNKVEQVFVNIFTNAVHAMPEGGTLAVKTYAAKIRNGSVNGHRVRIDLLRYRDTAIVAEVTDTGRGIQEKQLGKIFDPFFTTKPTGVGPVLG